MRVAPVFWATITTGQYAAAASAPAVWHSLIVSGTNLWRMTDATRASADTARDDAVEVHETTRPRPAAFAARSASYAAATVYDPHFVFVATNAVRYAELAAERSGVGPSARAERAFWAEISDDVASCRAGRADLIRVPLWQEKDIFDDLWQDTRTAWATRGTPWQFWIDWFDAALAGHPLGDDMLTEIALLPDELWEGDVDTLNARVMEIYRRSFPDTPQGIAH